MQILTTSHFLASLKGGFMSRIFSIAVTGLFLLLGSGVAANCGSCSLSAAQWKVYRSTVHGYELKFPSSWRLNQSRLNDFEIFNFPSSESVKGVVLPAGGAMLVLVPNFNHEKTIEAWMQADTKWARHKPVERTTRIPRKVPMGPDSCTEVTWDWEVGPNTFSRVTACYFVLGKQFFKAQVSYWANDPRQTGYRNLLIEILGTLSRNHEAIGFRK